MSKSVHDLALSGANKICNCSNCGTGFQCERKAWQSEHPLGGHGLPLFGKDTVCRLMDYPVQQSTDKRPWYKRSREEYEVTQDELVAICEECKHAVVLNDTIDRSACFTEHCMDCPVQHIIECNNEIAAEAQGS